MAGSKSDYLEAKILDLVLGAVAYTAPATIYVALSTALYSDAATGSAMNEVSSTSTGYARVAVTNSLTNFPAATGTNPTTKTNGTAITFPTATGSWGGAPGVQSFYFVDATTGGNVLYGGDLALAKVIAIGDTATFANSSIIVTED